MATFSESLIAEESRIYVTDLPESLPGVAKKKWLLVTRNYIVGVWVVNTAKGHFSEYGVSLTNVTKHAQEIGHYISPQLSDQVTVLEVEYHRVHFEGSEFLIGNRLNIFGRRSIIATIQAIVERCADEYNLGDVALMLLSLLKRKVK